MRPMSYTSPVEGGCARNVAQDLYAIPLCRTFHRNSAEHDGYEQSHDQVCWDLLRHPIAPSLRSSLVPYHLG